MRVELAAPEPSGPRAKLTFKWQGEGTGEKSKVICVVVGKDEQLVPRGERRSVVVRSHATELQRIVIDDRPHLISIPSGAEISLNDNPCFFYELSGPNTDAWFVDRSRAYCAPAGKACKPGFVRAAPPRPVTDELCGSTEKAIRRCVEEGEVRLASGKESRRTPTPDFDAAIPVATLADGPLRLAPRTCGFAMLDSGKEQVALVIGVGERWSLTVDADRRVSGVLLPR